jgi:hypothetical protein
VNIHRHLFILASILVISAISIFTYKIYVLNLPLNPTAQTSVWAVEAKMTFTAARGAVQVKLMLPPKQEHFDVIDENFISRSYGVTSPKYDASLALNNRESVWSLRKASGNQTLYYRLIIAASETNKQPQYATPTIPKGLTLEGAARSAAEAMIANARAGSIDTLSFAMQIVNELSKNADANTTLLLDRNASPEHVALMTVEVLKGANIASTIVHGFQLSNESNGKHELQLHPLLAVWTTTGWQYIDPANGVLGLPPHFLIWSVGDDPLFQVSRGKNPQVTFTASNQLYNAVSVASSEINRDRSDLLKFSLLSLPLQTQKAYQALIMVPLGALIILLLRNFVGIKTFGTFMPVLIALAFRETTLGSGLLLFTLVVSIGLLVRFYLEHLKLLLIPRLASVLVVVVIIFLLISVLSHHLGIDAGLSMALFPMVIITMTIERMSIVWEERNAWEAIQQGLGSLFAASIAYFAMENHFAQHLFFVFPELLLILLAIMLLMGRYRGYRISEIYRFESLFARS